MVARTDRMGDMILTAPLFGAVKQHFPNARLSVLASRANAQIAALLPAIDAIEIDGIEARDSGWYGTVALARRLRRLKIDAILFANAKRRLAASAWLARIPMRVGSGRRWYSVLYTARLPGRRYEHEIDWTLRLLQPLGVEAASVPPPRCPVAESDRRAVNELLTAEGVRAEAMIALVHPGNSGNALTASESWYARLGDELSAAGYMVVLTGIEGDRQLAARIAAEMRHKPVNLTGRLSVGQLAALCAQCAVCVGSSTGPTHLAAAVGAPTIGLYSPLVKQHRWLPRGPAVQVLRPEVGMSCPTCLGPRCPFFNCMNLIEHERVVAAARALHTQPRSMPASVDTASA
ncbi:MAG: glycosyltransferase family 9 protein [Candidatus Binatia bacterium]